MTQNNPDIIVALSNQIDLYSSLKAVCAKHNLTLYNILTPGIIASIDSEVSANPYILSEALSLLETTEHLSVFYAQGYVDRLKASIAKTRCTWKNHSAQVNEESLLQKDLMLEYFVASEEEATYFLDYNPVYLGLYIYILVRTISLQ